MTMPSEQPGQEQLRERVMSMMPEWRTSHISGFDYLSGGYSNQNYRFEVDQVPYVLRLPLRAPETIDRISEQTFYQQFHALNPAGLIPALVAMDTASGSMITHWQTGPLLIDQPPDTATLIDYLRSLHHRLPVTTRHYDPIAVSRRFLSIEPADADVVELAAVLRWPQEHGQPCHNDLNPWNVIRCEGDRWMTLDWEWFGNNDPLFDLITVHQGLGWGDDNLPVLAAELLGYQPDLERVTNCLKGFWLREYAWAHATLAVGNRREEIVEQKRQACDRLTAL